MNLELIPWTLFSGIEIQQRSLSHLLGSQPRHRWQRQCHNNWFALFPTSSLSFHHLKFVKCWLIILFWSRIRKGCIQVGKKKEKIVALWPHRSKTWNWEVLRRSCAMIATKWSQKYDDVRARFLFCSLNLTYCSLSSSCLPIRIGADSFYLFIFQWETVNLSERFAFCRTCES